MNFRTHPYRTVSLLIVAVLAFWTLVAYGVGLVWDKVFGPQAPTSLPAPWPSAGGSAVRTVPLPTGEMMAALPFRTAADALCTAIPEQTWSKLLGGPVALEIDGQGSCHVVTATLSLRAHLASAADDIVIGARRPVTVAGHRATLTGDQGAADAKLSVTIADAAPTTWVDPELTFALTRHPAADPDTDLLALVQGIGNAVVPAVTAPGPSLPRVVANALPPRQVSSVPGIGIADSALPMAAWQLCTQLAQTLGRPITDTQPRPDGSCDTQSGAILASASYSPPAWSDKEQSWPDSVAGRPARFDGTTVVVKLRDDSDQSVQIRYSVARSHNERQDLQDFADRMMPPLLGR
ncbi:hypothetical protein [Amycolatopsis sp. NBC_01480]|uniref:hypothetical protein n=1 Tax=Amycolatopsis sp. NBC_01480 TaxID=2903562 RepID=UPI002E2A97A5|nr:hypothetical protein [Amycolatopsis sp. NBC_01480]